MEPDHQFVCAARRLVQLVVDAAGHDLRSELGHFLVLDGVVAEIVGGVILTEQAQNRQRHRLVLGDGVGEIAGIVPGCGGVAEDSAFRLVKIHRHGGAVDLGFDDLAVDLVIAVADNVGARHHIVNVVDGMDGVGVRIHIGDGDQRIAAVADHHPADHLAGIGDGADELDIFGLHLKAVFVVGCGGGEGRNGGGGQSGHAGCGEELSARNLFHDRHPFLHENVLYGSFISPGPRRWKR